MSRQTPTVNLVDPTLQPPRPDLRRAPRLTDILHGASIPGAGTLRKVGTEHPNVVVGSNKGQDVMLHLRPVEICPLFCSNRECLAFEKVAIIESHGCRCAGLPCDLINRLTMLLELNGDVWARNPVLIVDVHGTPELNPARESQ